MPDPRRNRPTLGRVRTRIAALVGVLTCALVAGAPALAEDSSRTAPPSSDHRVLHPKHTSGNERGWIAAPVTGRWAPVRRSSDITREVVPGVTYTQWTQTDARGPIQAHLLTINPRTPGLKIDYADTGTVKGVATVPDILAVDGAVAGVNGDFYDIGRTGAPLGLGKDLTHGVLHGRTSGWNSAFYLDHRGRPTIGELPLVLRVRKHPEITLTQYNSPVVPSGGVGFYTPRWGLTSGYAVTQGQRKGVVAVWIKNHQVIRKTTKLKAGKPMRGSMLIGRGAGARQLKSLRIGSRVVVRARLQGGPRMAITGNHLLIKDGVVNVIDDRVMHPRTAVGIDRDTGEVLVLVVDGRRAGSRGYTMLELANLMVDLGADQALNLDGGGSSTMVARGTAGRNRVVNTPSDGFLRRVANALEVTYRAPKNR
ncbi:hypothetical protein GCM10009795_045030 [Nocardioides hankookensis]